MFVFRQAGKFSLPKLSVVSDNFVSLFLYVFKRVAYFIWNYLEFSCSRLQREGSELRYRHTGYEIINIHVMKVEFWGDSKTCPLVNIYRRFESDERSVKLFEYP